MIISHKYQFIFLKTAKTAGTSIEIALSRFCGQDDIITPVSVEDELKRQAAGGVAPQNYLVSPCAIPRLNGGKNSLATSRPYVSTTISRREK